MTNNTSNENARPPVAKLRQGLVTATIWQRESDNGSFYSVSFERSYKDSEGQWKTTPSFNAGDLLQLAKLADQAHTQIGELTAKAREATADEQFGEAE